MNLYVLTALKVRTPTSNSFNVVMCFIFEINSFPVIYIFIYSPFLDENVASFRAFSFLLF